MQRVLAACTRDVDPQGLALPALAGRELFGGGVKKPESLSVALDSRPETLVWTAVIVVGNPLAQHVFQVIFRKRYEKVQAFSADSPHQSFAEAICLRRSHRCAEHPNSHAFHAPIQVLRVDPIAVMDNVVICVISGQRLAELLQCPVHCRMSRDALMHDPACPDFHDQEYVEDPERGRYDHKEVAGYDALCVIPNEGHPTLLRIRSAPRAASLAQVLAYSTRRDSKTEFEPEFVGDSGFAPDSVLSCHSADEFPKIARQAGPASRPGLPPPEQAKSFPMPPNKGVGLDHAECAAPVKEPAQSGHHEPDRVGRPVRVRFALLEQCELFTEEEILSGQSGARPEA